MKTKNATSEPRRSTSTSSLKQIVLLAVALGVTVWALSFQQSSDDVALPLTAAPTEAALSTAVATTAVPARQPRSTVAHTRAAAAAAATAPLIPIGAPWSSTDVAHCLGGRSLISVGDSHGRQMLEALLDRVAPELKSDKSHKPFDHTVKLASGQVTTLHQRFAPLVSSVITSPGDLPRPSPGHQQHVIVSRGAWDVVFFATPLRVFFEDLVRVLREAAQAPGVESVTLRLPQPFRTLQHPTLQPCVDEGITRAYRQLAACAAATVATNTSGGGGAVLIGVLDPTEMAVHANYKKDGVHLASRYATALTDAWLNHAVCRRREERRSNIWFSTQPAAIASRFGCAALESLMTEPLGTARASSLAHRLRPIEAAKLPLEVAFGFGTRYRCRCQDPATKLNDQCAVLHDVMTNSRDERATRFARYVCAGRRAPRGTFEHGVETNFSQALMMLSPNAAGAASTSTPPDSVWLGEIALELCANPALAPVAFANAGFVHEYATVSDGGGGTTARTEPIGLCHDPADSDSTRRTLPWCAAQAARLDSVVRSLRLLWGDETLSLGDALRRASTCDGNDGWAEGVLSAAFPLLCSEQWSGDLLKRRKRPAGGSGPEATAVLLVKERLGLLQWAANNHGADWNTAQKHGLQSLITRLKQQLPR